MEIVWIHNNCIFPYYGYSIEIVWIYYGFSGAIANFIAWISRYFLSVFLGDSKTVYPMNVYYN